MSLRPRIKLKRCRTSEIVMIVKRVNQSRSEMITLLRHPNVNGSRNERIRYVISVNVAINNFVIIYKGGDLIDFNHFGIRCQGRCSEQLLPVRVIAKFLFQ